MLFQALKRPHVEYVAAVWNQYKVSDIESIENVKRGATKLTMYSFVKRPKQSREI